MRLYVIAIFLVALSVQLVVGDGRDSFAAQKNVGVWVKELREEARHAGVPVAVFDKVFKDFRPIERVIRLDRKQPEGTKTFSQYMKAVLPMSRVEEGRRLYRENKQLLDEIAARYGVQPRFIVALWGIETSYGKITGNFNVPHALATLAYDGRRASFFRRELINALKIISEGHITYEKMKGSWAGAMGQSQFMPSSFIAYAVDYDGDGRRDIWGTKADIFASIANYLSKAGWNDELTWGRKVRLPKGFDKRLADIRVFRKLSEWQRLGVRRESGANLPQVDVSAALIFPDSQKQHPYLIYSNYNVLLKWNKSRYFACAVGTLADRIIGR